MVCCLNCQLITKMDLKELFSSVVASLPRVDPAAVTDRHVLSAAATLTAVLLWKSRCVGVGGEGALLFERARSHLRPQQFSVWQRR
jgi:hypothetical protein